MAAITRCLSRFCEESKLRSSTAKGHLFVITGRLTFSAAMNLASRLEHETHATFVGEPTGSRPNHYGEAVTLTLPQRRNKGRFHDSLGLTPAFSELFVGAFPFEPPTR